MTVVALGLLLLVAVAGPMGEPSLACQDVQACLDCVTGVAIRCRECGIPDPWNLTVPPGLQRAE